MKAIKPGGLLGLNLRINEFRQLKEKRSKFNYRLLFYRDYEDFEKIVKQIIKNKEVIPMLIWLEKGSGE